MDPVLTSHPDYSRANLEEFDITTLNEVFRLPDEKAFALNNAIVRLAAIVQHKPVAVDETDPDAAREIKKIKAIDGPAGTRRKAKELVSDILSGAPSADARLFLNRASTEKLKIGLARLRLLERKERAEKSDPYYAEAS